MNYDEYENLLSKISVNRLIGVFWEFLVDYLVHEKIDKELPYFPFFIRISIKLYLKLSLENNI